LTCSETPSCRPSIGFEIDIWSSTSVCAEESIVAELYGLVAYQMTGLVNIIDLQLQSAGIGGSDQASAHRKLNSAQNGVHGTQIEGVSI
jgi:hypothetical protein